MKTLLGILLSMIGTVAMAQAPSPAAQAKAETNPKPTLKSEVALPIRNLELKQTQRLLQIKQLEAQYTQIQKEYQEDGTKLSALVASAIKDSGLDPVKYTVNADSLEVTELPKPPAPPVTEPKK